MTNIFNVEVQQKNILIPIGTRLNNAKQITKTKAKTNGVRKQYKDNT